MRCATYWLGTITLVSVLWFYMNETNRSALIARAIHAIMHLPSDVLGQEVARLEGLSPVSPPRGLLVLGEQEDGGSSVGGDLPPVPDQLTDLLPDIRGQGDPLLD